MPVVKFFPAAADAGHGQLEPEEKMVHPSGRMIALASALALAFRLWPEEQTHGAMDWLESERREGEGGGVEEDDSSVVVRY
jgi:hypothetical protein